LGRCNGGGDDKARLGQFFLKMGKLIHGQYIRSKDSLMVKNTPSHGYRGEIQEQKLEVKN
jgi:hypothetical protein